MLGLSSHRPRPLCPRDSKLQLRRNQGLRVKVWLLAARARHAEKERKRKADERKAAKAKKK